MSYEYPWGRCYKIESGPQTGTVQLYIRGGIRKRLLRVWAACEGTPTGVSKIRLSHFDSVGGEGTLVSKVPLQEGDAAGDGVAAHGGTINGTTVMEYAFNREAGLLLTFEDVYFIKGLTTGFILETLTSETAPINLGMIYQETYG
jgi:hypothetical protein